MSLLASVWRSPQSLCPAQPRTTDTEITSLKSSKQRPSQHGQLANSMQSSPIHVSLPAVLFAGLQVSPPPSPFVCVSVCQCVCVCVCSLYSRSLQSDPVMKCDQRPEHSAGMMEARPSARWCGQRSSMSPCWAMTLISLGLHR